MWTTTPLSVIVYVAVLLFAAYLGLTALVEISFQFAESLTRMNTHDLALSICKGLTAMVLGCFVAMGAIVQFSGRRD